jgi:hypothetical protein
MSIDVPAIARSKRGLCCETKDPMRRPLAQKLRVSIPGNASAPRRMIAGDSQAPHSLLMPYTTDRQPFS